MKGLGLRGNSAACLLVLYFSFLSTALAKVHLVQLGGAPLVGKKQTHPHLRRAHHAAAFERSLGDSHDDVLARATNSEVTKLYSYTHLYNGFAADLTDAQVEILRDMPEVESVLEDIVYHPQSSHSYEYMGLDQTRPTPGVWSKSTGAGVIIGVFDSGLNPEAPSFRDRGMGPIPARWKGKCIVNASWRTNYCNKKVIGAKFFPKAIEKKYNISYSDPSINELRSARDVHGHGSHVASIAAGNVVPNVQINGIHFGTTKGVAHKAHIAVYKVCWTPFNNSDPYNFANTKTAECLASDILAALEEATKDGIDVASMALGVKHPLRPIEQHGRDIGSLFAAMAGVTVVVAAGNDGPTPRTMQGNMPWYITAASSTDDRSDLSSTVTLGSQVTLTVSSLTLLVGAFEPNATYIYRASQCLRGYLEPSKVAGKIVLCDRGIGDKIDKSFYLKGLGAAGMILGNIANSSAPVADYMPLPFTSLAFAESESLRAYINGSGNPTASIGSASIKLGQNSPVMLASSSVGPNDISPGILKPDVTAPGSNILGAWSKFYLTDYYDQETGLVDERSSQFSRQTGTSMSVGQVAGIAALVKAINPKWTPAMIQSAIMTTATTKTRQGTPIQTAFNTTATPFNYGNGHVQPNDAITPGLVYNAGVADYVGFLCCLGYTDEQVFKRVGKHCPLVRGYAKNYNYPSFAVPGVKKSVVISRTLTNVGPASTYTAKIVNPPGIVLKIVPGRLTFTAGQTQVFRVSVRVKSITRNPATSDYAFGSITWTDGTRSVKSSMAVQADQAM
eukprot:jgi/Mesen1/7098/ME000369S06421